MKKDGINIMIFGLGLTIISAVFYFFNLNESVTDKFVITIGNSFHFHWGPMIGILTMAIGEFLLWQSQHNKNLKEVGIKFLNKFKMNSSNFRLEAIYVSHLKFVNMKVVRFIVSIFHI